MSQRKAKLGAPGSQQATAAADAQIREQYGVSQIDPDSPEAAEMHKAWMDAYVANGGPVENMSASHVDQVIQKIDQSRPPRQLNKPVQGCDQHSDPPATNTTIPCDVLRLHVGLGGQDFTADRRLTADPPPAEALSRLQDYLKTYDLAVEVVSAYLLSKDSWGGPDAKNVVELITETNWYGECPIHNHPLIVLDPQDGQDSSFAHQWTSAQPPKLQIPARSPGFLEKEFGWCFLSDTDPMELVLSATSCGVRFDRAANYELSALLRIYPKDDWVISLTLPAALEKSRRFSRQKNLSTGDVTNSNSSSTEVWGASTSENSWSQTTDKSGAITKQSGALGSTQGGSYVESSYSKKADGSQKYEERTTSDKAFGQQSKTTQFYSEGEIDQEAEPDEWQTAVSLSVSRNGSQLDITQLAATVINAIQAGKKAFEAFKDLLNAVPKVGVTVDMSLTLFEGSISYSRGYRSANELTGDRYATVTSYGDVTISCTIIDASFDAGFGFELTIPSIVSWFKTKNILEVILKAAAELGISCDWAGTDKCQEDQEIESELKATTKMKAYVNATATVLGTGLQSEGGVRSNGFYLNGKAAFSFKKPPTATAEIGFDSGEAYAYFFTDLVIWDYSDHWEYPLWTKHPFYEGPFPPQAEAPTQAIGASA